MPERLENLGWTVASYEGPAAAKDRVVGVRNPRILHGHPRARDRAGHGRAGRQSAPPVHAHLAGANAWTAEHASGEGAVGDGILTANEVTGLDLRDTELVNLTACETGVGEVTPDGVVGVRQAFVLAGARAVTMGMWRVPTLESVEQMVDFYIRWLGPDASECRYASLRAAQLARLAAARQDAANECTGQPFFWAGSIYVGDPGDLA